MGQERIFWKPGDRITLGEMEYQIEYVEGYGNSAVVYRAFYEDALNRGGIHQVLIKELYPWDPRGRLGRGTDGAVTCVPEGEEFFRAHKRNFYRGNQVNLDLLRKSPGQISGNLNSYEAYGTFYSVLTLHGGRTLEELLCEGKRLRSLQEAAEMLCRILEALQCFHENGILHLDISPDNILVLEHQVLLIDYSSVWFIKREPGDTALFSMKEGYSPPEVRLRQEKAVGPASDLYSVGAVFFRILSGRRLSEEESAGRGLKKALPPELEIFQGEPYTALCKTWEIIRRSLQGLPRKRYQHTGEMILELQELTRRIRFCGVTESALWEGSRRAWQMRSAGSGRGLAASEDPWIPQKLLKEAGEEGREALKEALGRGECFLLTGSGGMGKSRFLQELWRQGAKRYHPAEPVVCFVALADYQSVSGEEGYIKNSLLAQINMGEEPLSEKDALLALDRLWSPEGRQRVVLLLDGLNEAGGDRSGLLREIEELGKKPGLGILLTDRTGEAGEYALAEFQLLKLSPFPPSQVRACLQEKGISAPEEEKSLALLGNPMMLSLYCRLEGDPDAPGGLTESELIQSYLDRIGRQEQKSCSGNLPEQLRRKYVLNFLLPEIAWEMQKKKRILLSLEELLQTAEKNYQALRRKTFGLANQEYLGKSRSMLRDIQSPQEWFDYAVTEQLISGLNLLLKTEKGNYRLIHEKYREPLAGNFRRNRERELPYRKRALLRKAAALLAAAALVLPAGGYAVMRLGGGRVSQEEMAANKGAVQRLMMNLTNLDIMLNGQYLVLEDAQSQGVLERDPIDTALLEGLIRQQKEELGRYQAMTGENTDWIEALIEAGSSVPVDTLQSLYLRPVQMGSFLEKALTHLEEGLCPEDSPYRTAEQREPLTETYREYLDAYGKVCYLELSRVLMEMDEENRQEAYEALSATQVFSKLHLDGSLRGDTREEVEGLLDSAGQVLNQAAGQMRMQNYEV